jgi:hypothetical protein
VPRINEIITYKVNVTEREMNLRLRLNIENMIISPWICNSTFRNNTLFLDHTSTQNKNTSRSAASNLTEAPTNRKIVISGGKMTPIIGVRHTTETKV